MGTNAKNKDNTKGKAAKDNKTKANKKNTIGLSVLGILVVIIVIGITIVASSMGGTAGKYIGTILGGIKGIAEYSENYEEGKAEGLSAKDTQVEIGNSIRNVANLEVMVASVKIDNYHTYGKEDSTKYEALYLMNADAVFAVDLSYAETALDEENHSVHITLPQPNVEVYIDDSNKEKLYEYDAKFFDGSAKDGIIDYINSHSQLEEKTKNSIASDGNLMESARISAQTQIEELVKSINTDIKTVEIDWE